MLIVFDLDFTLWDAGGTWCDHLSPPFVRRNGDVVDRQGSCVQLYPDVRSILQWCRDHGVSTAIASRTGEPSWARELLDLFEIRNHFDYEQIYPGSKQYHFNALRRESGHPYERMIFFDDEYRNIEDVQALGVHAVHVPNGLTRTLFEKIEKGIR